MTNLSSESPAYLNADLPVEQRVDDLIARMTLAEKVSQMVNDSPAVERLGIPEYNWWNECLHGVARAGIATVFPQAIGLAATWNTDLLYRAAVVTSDEGRAKHHEAVRQGNRGWWYGLTFWSPNVNIFRDPRWGRGQETYGEDPFLTARMGVVFVKGLQGDDPHYLKLVATPKHYAVHSGPEHARHHFDAQADERDLRETYLPAFKACVREGKAYSIMGAYNRTNGEACCASPTLLQKILRDEWGFDGYVVSDCGAIDDIHKHHQMVPTAAEASAMAVKAGCDLECGWCGGSYAALVEAVEKGLIDEATIDLSLRRLFMARFLLGMFDPPERVAYAQIPYEINDAPAHRELALQTARESIVLLKNAHDFLPLRKDTKTIAVIGPNADSVPVLLGNYNGTPSKAVTLLQGIKAKVSQGTQVLYFKGCNVTGQSREGFADAVHAARSADVVILALGLNQSIEGEEGQEEGVSDGRSQADRTHLDLPGVQQELLEAVHAAGKPVVLVLVSGSAVAINWADEHLPAILAAWYPGEEGGTAVAEVLFGDYNPAGRLPVTFYKSVDDLPPFEDYRMEGRTYRYFRGEPLYPFGHGLSYTRFAYDDLRLDPAEVKAGDSVQITARVRNVGDLAGDEVAQLYVRDFEASAPVPLRRLAGFARVSLAPGEAQTVTFGLAPEQMSLITDDGRRVIEPGVFEVWVGGGQPGYSAPGISGGFEVTGAAAELEL